MLSLMEHREFETRSKNSMATASPFDSSMENMLESIFASTLTTPKLFNIL